MAHCFSSDLLRPDFRMLENLLPAQEDLATLREAFWSPEGPLKSIPKLKLWG